MNYEIRNIILSCKNIVFFIELIYSITCRICIRYQRKLSYIYNLNISKDILSKSSVVSNTELINKDYLTLWCQPIQRGAKLLLANGDCHIINQANDWNLNVADPEIRDSLHRWGWLLHDKNHNNGLMSFDEGIELLRSCLGSQVGNKYFSEDIYSSCERIVNSILFIVVHHKKDIPKDIEFALKKMVISLAENLEYYDCGRFGNHIINNARALYFAGYFMGMKSCINLSEALIRHHLPFMILRSGFLREESSHYHFLFTRWIVEIYWIAGHENNIEIQRFLSSYAIRLLHRSWFFLIKNNFQNKWEIPLIGDISPDCTPDSLISLLWTKSALSLYAPEIMPEGQVIFNSWQSFLNNVCVTLDQNREQVIGNISEDWFKIEKFNFTLFIKAQASNGRIIANHAHNDFTSFVLYFKGRCVFLDCGRFDYTNSSIGTYGKTAHSHNVLMINNLPPSPEPLSWAPSSYKSISVITTICEDKGGIEFTLKHDGFSRIAGYKIKHTRKFIIRENSFDVVDSIDGDKFCSVNVLFHISNDLNFKKVDKFLWNSEDMNIQLHFDKYMAHNNVSLDESGSLSGLSSRQYGKLERCTTFELKGKLILPAIITNSLRV